LKDGAWAAAPSFLFAIDLFYPVITKTLCSFFTCRNLGAAGWWLEQDYSVQCGDASEDNSKFIGQYAAYRPWVFVAAVVVAFGVPGLFLYLVYKFKPLAMNGDTVVRKALGWPINIFAEL